MLAIGGNELLELPEWIKEPSKLKELNIDHNYKLSTHFPNWIVDDLNASLGIHGFEVLSSI